jgi:hypothetical protein
MRRTGKVQFMANKDFIIKLRSQGHTIQYIYDVLKKKTKLSISYTGFYYHFKLFKLHDIEVNTQVQDTKLVNQVDENKDNQIRVNLNFDKLSVNKDESDINPVDEKVGGIGPFEAAKARKKEIDEFLTKRKKEKETT